MSSKATKLTLLLRLISALQPPDSSTALKKLQEFRISSTQYQAPKQWHTCSSETKTLSSYCSHIHSSANQEADKPERLHQPDVIYNYFFQGITSQKKNVVSFLCSKCRSKQLLKSSDFLLHADFEHRPWEQGVYCAAKVKEAGICGQGQGACTLGMTQCCAAPCTG